MNKHLQSDRASYDETFFNEIANGSLSSAEAIVPFVMKAINPRSILDVGCAEGAWLSVFNHYGVSDHLGIDGDYVDRGRLLIDKSKFIATDLQMGFDLDRRFDLAICLEVAEHLPIESAGRIVESLTKHASCVLFSASIPFQDGTGHINEQWPNYWAGLFLAQGFSSADIVRREFWNNRQVKWWFAQNIIVYYDPHVHDFSRWSEGFDQSVTTADLRAIVHPELLYHKERKINALTAIVGGMNKQQTSLYWLTKQIVKLLLGRA